MLRVFLGYDPRQPLAYTVLHHSIIRHATEPVSITPLVLSQLPIKRRGLTEFTYSRFLVPWLCGYRGRAVFMDSDIAVSGDIAELFSEADYRCAVAVMQNQAKFEWASVMVFNCEHCTILTPEYIDEEIHPLFPMEWVGEDHPVGHLPWAWNHCVSYTKPKPAKLYHYTAGIPCWPETNTNPEDVVWQEELEAAMHTVSWQELMGKSVHAQRGHKPALRMPQLGPLP